MHAYVYHIYTQLCDLSLDIILHSECILELSEPGNLKLILAVQGWLGDVSLDKKRVILDQNAQIKQPPKTAGFDIRNIEPLSIQKSGEKKIHRL